MHVRTPAVSIAVHRLPDPHGTGSIPAAGRNRTRRRKSPERGIRPIPRSIRMIDGALCRPMPGAGRVDWSLPSQAINSLAVDCTSGTKRQPWAGASFTAIMAETVP